MIEGKEKRVGSTAAKARVRQASRTYVGDLEFVKFLQMLGEYLDELARRYVFHSVYVLVEFRKVLLQHRTR